MFNNDYLIGIDIGGTNTDAVLMNHHKTILSVCKTPTTDSLAEGVEKAITTVLSQASLDPKAVKGLFVGTTQATNAILERKGLLKVGVIRIAGQKPESIASFPFCPLDLRQAVFAGCEHIDGGYECDGRVITPFNRAQAKEAALKLRESGAESIAIVGVFSSLNNEQEVECSVAVQEVLGKNFPLSMSHAIGGVGFIERENGTILNCALKAVMRRGFQDLETVKGRLGMTCPLWVTQNDGSIISLDQAIDFPLLTISSGPTNSFMGAAKLCAVQDAIIVDIGGTSSDIGLICNGYPKRSIHNVNIGGVHLNFRMPDVFSLPIGGGSYVVPKPETQWHVSQRSCGKQLTREAELFGGKSLTLTDAACQGGFHEIPEGNKALISMTAAEAKSVMRQTQCRIHEGIKKMKGSLVNLPVIVVGGAAFLLNDGLGDRINPPYFNVANAYGAALASISATIDTIASLENRTAILDQLKSEAHALAVKNGADLKKTRIVDFSVMPFPYLPNQLARIIVKAAGPMS